jgi:capsular exopolysaccharide synthesis family protein
VLVVGSMTKVMQKIWQGGSPHGPAAGEAAAFDASVSTLVDLPGHAASAFVGDDGPRGAPRPSRNGETVAWQPQQVDRAIVAFHNRHGAICEQYRGLRARLLSMNPTRAAQALVVTSAVPEEGKSVSALNLALVMAEGGEHRILLVDADFRRGSLARLLGLERSPGLAEVLRREVGMQDALRPTPLPNLKILAAGKVTDSAYGELLGSGHTTAVLAEFRSAFDYTFLDAPPITTVSDVCLLAPPCDGALVVIQMHGASEPTVQQGIRALRANNIRVLGAILSRFDRQGPGYYDYYDSAPYHE